MQEVGHAVPEVYIRYMQGTAHYPQNGVWTLSLHETDRRRAGKTDGEEVKSECEMEKNKTQVMSGECVKGIGSNPAEGYSGVKTIMV